MIVIIVIITPSVVIALFTKEAEAVTSNKILEGQKFFWSHKIAQTLSHVLGMNLLDQYFCQKNSQTKKIKEF